MVYNLRGQRVRTLVDEELSRGEHRTLWLGRDDHGATVASGVYFVEMKAAGKTLTRRVVLLR